MKTNTKIETYLGNQIDLLNPKPHQIDIRDIACGLAMTVRFGGHLNNFLSVAQHSVNTAKLLSTLGYSPRIQLYGLLHDAPEAYLGDIVRPLKRMLPDYKDLEAKMMKAILKALGLNKFLKLNKDEHQAIKEADDTMVVYERHELKPHCEKKNGWKVFQAHASTRAMQNLERPSDKLICLNWLAAEALFLKYYKDLRGI